MVAEKNGAWDAAQDVPSLATLNLGGFASGATSVPGLSALNKDHSAAAAVVSCHAPADCVAACWYHDNHGRQQAFVIATQ